MSGHLSCEVICLSVVVPKEYTGGHSQPWAPTTRGPVSAGALFCRIVVTIQKMG